MDRLLWDETRRSGGANNLERVLKKHIARQPEMRTDAISGRWIDPASNSGMIFTTFDQRVICSYRRNDAMSYCRTNAFSVDPCTRVLYVYASEYGHQSEGRTSGNSCNATCSCYRFGHVVLGRCSDLRYVVFSYTEVAYSIHKVPFCRTMK